MTKQAKFNIAKIAAIALSTALFTNCNETQKMVVKSPVTDKAMTEASRGIGNSIRRANDRPFMPKTAIITGADLTETYLPYLANKKVGMVINQTSVIGESLTPSVDTLLTYHVNIKKIFGPEHGFRGNASDGAKVEDSVDAKTGIPAVSLYGKHNKPTPDDLKGLDILIFDIQDVGARFYTYISTLHYVMEACAENNLELMILDRPNPNGFYVDGPVLDTALHSFVGMHKIPIVHGMTIAEYAQMINGEGWLKNKVKCKLKIIRMQNYVHALKYTLPVKTSPNLPPSAVLLYPSLCLFEGTSLSLGRGTAFPFQVYGSPLLDKNKFKFSFTPQSIPGVSDNPPLKGQLCYGVDLRNYKTANKIDLSLVMNAYKNFPDKEHFFIAYFTKLAGTKQLQKQIESGMSEGDIRMSWEPALSQFKLMRKKYLIYQ